MKKLHFALILPCFLFSLSIQADQYPLKPETQGDITFVSGGIGETERTAMQDMKADYNLNLLFAYKGTGEFISDVNVQIADRKGNALVETLAVGPYLFARLKPGNYIVTAEKEGKQIRRKATVTGRKTTSLSFYWPRQNSIPDAR